MGRIMGVDYGLRYIGIAMTDMMQIVASPYDTIESVVCLKQNALKIIEIAKDRNVSAIVFGLPINMNGTEGKMALTVRKVIEKIKSFSSMKITVMDERLTTIQAERMLIDEANISREKRKGLKDKISASFILQIYLDTYSKS
jgi:putative Holliday junction resolvase